VPADVGQDTLEAVFRPGTSVSCPTAVAVDVDGDGQVDDVRLQVHEQTGEVRLVALPQGWALAQWPALDGPFPVATWLRAKPPGVAVQRDALSPSDAAALTSVGAVEVCSPPGGWSAVPTAPADQRCYCSVWLRWSDGLVSVQACD
jgi:hypothetical protein